MLIAELGVGCPHICTMLSLARIIGVIVAGHGRIGHVHVLRGRGKLVFHHRHARVRRLDNVVVFDGTEVEQRFFLNSLARSLLGLTRHVSLNGGNVSLYLHLLTRLECGLLDCGGNLVDRVVMLHFLLFVSREMCSNV